MTLRGPVNRGSDLGFTFSRAGLVHQNDIERVSEEEEPAA